jgi:sugar-specific transcriptional regulator TrmB
MEGAGLLAGLGLSNRQAWVYLALLRSGDSRGRIIASIAGVPRQEVYGLLLELQQLGLVEKKLTFPVSYTAIPFPQAVKALFEAKASELNLISQKAERVTEKFIQNPPALLLREPLMPCFGVVCEGERGKKYSVAFERAMQSVELVFSWVRFRQLCFHFEGELKTALKRGVHIRAVVEKPPRHYFPKWISGLDSSVFELWTVPVSPSASLAIFDGREVALAFDSEVRVLRGPDLWSSHLGLVAVCRGFFDAQWMKPGVMGFAGARKGEGQNLEVLKDRVAEEREANYGRPIE